MSKRVFFSPCDRESDSTFVDVDGNGGREGDGHATREDKEDVFEDGSSFASRGQSKTFAAPTSRLQRLDLNPVFLSLLLNMNKIGV